MGRRSLLLAGMSLAGACLALTLFFPVVPFRLRSLARLHEYAHVPLFALVTLGLAPALPGFTAPEAGRRGRALLRAVLLAILLGGLVELLQPRFGGTTEMGDLVRDALGAVAGGLFLLGRTTAVPTALGRALQGVAAGLILVPAWPAASAAWDELLARRQLPVLADFETRFQVERFISYRCRLERLPDPGGGGHVLGATFLPDLYPRLTLRDYPADWREFRALTFDALNPGDAPFPLIIRIDDVHHDGRMADRFTLRVELAPGRQTIVVPLSAVESAPEGRSMDLSALADITLYGYRLGEERAVLFDNFRLLPREERGVTGPSR